MERIYFFFFILNWGSQLELKKVGKSFACMECFFLFGWDWPGVKKSSATVVL